LVHLLGLVRIFIAKKAISVKKMSPSQMPQVSIHLQVEKL